MWYIIGYIKKGLVKFELNFNVVNLSSNFYQTQLTLVSMSKLVLLSMISSEEFWKILTILLPNSIPATIKGVTPAAKITMQN